MANEITQNQIPTFDEFKSLLQYEQAGSLLDKTADLYDRIPGIIRLAHNFDPTGFVSAIDQCLSENRAEREKENLVRALYELTLAINKLGHKLFTLEQGYLRQNIPLLTYLYFEQSERTFQSSKIELFRNIWLNGLRMVNRRLSEKSSIFDLVNSLTEEDILALRIVFESSPIIEGEEIQPTAIDFIAEKSSLDIAYTQQICVRLQSRGLLLDYGLGFLDYKGPVWFVLTDFAKIVIEYITEPSDNAFANQGELDVG